VKGGFNKCSPRPISENIISSSGYDESPPEIIEEDSDEQGKLESNSTNQANFMSNGPGSSI
jgi:hypothetical protein